MRLSLSCRRSGIDYGTLLALVLSTTTVWAQSANSQNADLDELNNKLKQLEQQMQELRGQISAVQQAQKSQAAETSGTAAPAPKNEKPANVPPAEEHKTTLDLYGFAMLDSGYDFKTNDPNWFDVIRPTKLPSAPGQFAPDGKVYYGVRQTRFGVKSSTPTALGALKTQFEFELFGTGVDAGQTTFRLRHAYGELGQFGAGQTWSPFMDIDVFPNSIEYWGPNGMVFFRNVQFRWMPLKGRNDVTIAIERPGASGDQGIFQDRIELQGIRPRFDLPDLSGHLRLNRDWGHVQIAGIVRRIRWIDVVNDQFDLSGDDIGWGATVSSNVKFGKNDIGRFQVVYGEGIENYMNDAPVDIGIKVLNPSDPIRPIKGVALPVLGIVSFLDHNWNKKFSSSVGYSMVNIENSSGQAANAYHRGHYGLTNLLYYPVENVMLGGEFQWGRRENFHDGFTADDYRIQFSFRYNFSKIFGL